MWNFSDQGPRDSQEDVVFQTRFLLKNITSYNKTVVWVVGVADGHNGDEISLFLKNYIPDSIKCIIQNKHQHLNKDEFVELEILEKEIIDVIKNIDTIFSKYHQNEENDEMKVKDPGAVLSFYVVYNNNVLVFQLGDTKILIFDKEGNCIFQTPTHDKSNDSEVQRITLQGGIITGSRICYSLQPSRVIGDLGVKKAFPLIFLNEPETFVIPIHDDCMSLFAVTDGIKTENLTEFQNYAKSIGSKPYSASYVDKNLFLSNIIDPKVYDNKTVSFQFFMK